LYRPYFVVTDTVTLLFVEFESSGGVILALRREA
jgi:hypothetical protein